MVALSAEFRIPAAAARDRGARLRDRHSRALGRAAGDQRGARDRMGRPLAPGRRGPKPPRPLQRPHGRPPGLDRAAPRDAGPAPGPAAQRAGRRGGARPGAEHRGRSGRPRPAAPGRRPALADPPGGPDACPADQRPRAVRDWHQGDRSAGADRARRQGRDVRRRRGRQDGADHGADPRHGGDLHRHLGVRRDRRALARGSRAACSRCASPRSSSAPFWYSAR